MLKPLAWTVLGAVNLLACHETAEGPEMPEIVASSKYIDYSPVGETSAICMDEALAREDRFIEETAAFLGVDPPSGRIRFIRNPMGDFFEDSGPWACPGAAFNCYTYDEIEDAGLIRSIGWSHSHELVHAVEIPALGADGHRTLIEGLADYLGSADTSEDVLDGFPGAFKAMVARSPMPDDYRLAMHFVGSLLRNHGLGKYKALREALPAEGDLAALESAFLSVYGESLEVALETMSGEAIQGLLKSTRCNGEAEELSWTSPGVLETTLRGECGDPTFVGPGFSSSRPGFFKVFEFEVTEVGYYRLTLTGTDGVGSTDYSLIPCPGVETGLYASAGGLYPGRYELGVGYPAGPEARGELNLKLEFVAPF